MIALAIVLAVLVLLALLPVGAAMEYDEGGARVWLTLGFVRVQLLPARPKKPKKEKKAAPRAKHKGNPAEKQEKKGGRLPPLLELIRLGRDLLGALRRKLLLRELTLYFTYGGSDPAETAIRYGKTVAAAHAVMPLIEQLFRVRRQDVRILYDARESELAVYARAAASVRLGALIALAFYYGFRALRLFLAQRAGNQTEDKAVSK